MVLLCRLTNPGFSGGVNLPSLDKLCFGIIDVLLGVFRSQVDLQSIILPLLKSHL